jgi:hypothetical protein
MNRTVVLSFDTRMIIIAGAFLVMIAVAMPWANLPSFVAGELARGGIVGGGLITLGLAALALLSLLLPWHPRTRVSLPAAIAGALVYLVALSVFVRIVQLSGNLGLDLLAQPSRIGSGLFLTFAGAVLMMVGGLASATPPPSLAWLTVSDRPWLGYAIWLALAAALLASCLCAWGVGWLTQAYTLGAPGQSNISPTFAPVPTTDFATPLVGIQLLPLGSVTVVPVPSASATLIRSTQPVRATLTSPVATPTTAAGGVPTIQPSSPTPPLSPTLPVIGVPTPTLTTAPTPTNTPTSTFTPNPSPQETPTVTLTPTSTVTTTMTATATSTATPTP